MKRFSLKYSNLAPLWIAVFVDILGFSIILPFLPFFLNEFNTNPVVIGLLLSSNAIFAFFFGPILSKLSDIYGRKPLLLISQAGTIAGFIILIFANNIETLFIARIVDGIFGGQFPISKAVIGDVVPPEDRPKQMTNIGVTFTLAFLIGPALGGFLSSFGIAGPAILASILAIFTMLFTGLFLKESLPMKINKKNIVVLEEHDTLKINIDNKSTPVYKNKNAMILLIQYTFIVLAAGVFQGTFSLFGFLRLNLNEQMIGLLLTSMGLFQVIFRSLAFNKLRNYLGDPKTAMLGLASFILSYFLLGFVSELWQLVLILFYISFSGATSRGITIGFTSRSVDFRNQGKIMGISSSLDNLSQIFGPIVGGILLALPNNSFYGIFLSMLSIIPFIISFQVLKLGYDNRTIAKGNLKYSELKPSADIH